MGDMADYYMEQDAMFDCGYETEDDYAINYPSQRTCRNCGEEKLHWESINGKWLLCNRQHNIHQCPVKPLLTTKQDDIPFD